MKTYFEVKPETIVYGTEPLGPEIISKLEALKGIPFDAIWDSGREILRINTDELHPVNTLSPIPYVTDYIKK